MYQCRDRDRGQALPLVIVLLMAVAAVAVITGRIGRALVDQARARTAADAAVVAGVRGGREAAREMAAENGGTLVSYDDGLGVVEVRVSVGRAVALARATRSTEPMWSDTPDVAAWARRGRADRRGTPTYTAVHGSRSI